MKSLIPLFGLILFFESCITSNHAHYSDPNYLTSNEFNTYEEEAINNIKEETKISSFNNDTSEISNNDYNSNHYYDYSFSSRIRRFHGPIYSVGYYDGFYTDLYWYNNDPFSWGTSIYYGYNWSYPYYSYSPFYFGHYYNPYYLGHHYPYNTYGHNHYGYYNTSYSNNYNSYITGNRGSLSARSGFQKNGRRNITANTVNKSSLNIKNNIDRNNNIRKHNSSSSIRNIIKGEKRDIDRRNTSIRENKNDGSRNRTIRSNSNRTNNYSTPRNTNSRYNSERRNNRSNNNKGSSRSGRTKPRR